MRLLRPRPASPLLLFLRRASLCLAPLACVAGSGFAAGACTLDVRGLGAESSGPSAQEGSSGGTSSGSPESSGVTTGAGGSGGASGATSSSGGGDDGGGGPIVAPFCDVANPSIVACYEFEMEVKDGSAYGNNPDMQKDVTYAPGKSGFALERGPMSVVIIPGSPSLDNISVGAIELWIKPSKLPDSGRMGLLDKDGQYSAFLYAGGDIRCGIGSFVIAKNVVKAGEWSHVACVSDGVMQTIYVNGKAAISDGSDPQPAGAQRIVIGADSPVGSTDMFEGLMDSLRIWKVARTAAEICEAAGGSNCP